VRWLQCVRIVGVITGLKVLRKTGMWAGMQARGGRGAVISIDSLFLLLKFKSTIAALSFAAANAADADAVVSSYNSGRFGTSEFNTIGRKGEYITEGKTVNKVQNEEGRRNKGGTIHSSASLRSQSVTNH
jgi:hypothetical protein